jgi:hypothetical protein
MKAPNRDETENREARIVSIHLPLSNRPGTWNAPGRLQIGSPKMLSWGKVLTLHRPAFEEKHLLDRFAFTAAEENAPPSAFPSIT